MASRHVDRLLIIERGLLSEASALDKSLERGLERDYFRLESLASAHGIALFTTILPALGKWLDASLDAGFLLPTTARLTARVSKRTNVPRLFQGVWLKVFTPSGVLRNTEELDPTFVLILKNLLVLGKKIELSLPGKSRRGELAMKDSAVYSTVKEFFHADASLPPAQKDIWVDCRDDLDHGVTGSLLDAVLSEDRVWIGTGAFSSRAKSLLELCQQIADRVTTSTFDREIRPETLRFRHGPGATSEYQRGGGYKYDFPHWPARLEQTFAYDSVGVANFNSLIDDDGSSQPLGGFDADIPSRLCCVPKDARGPRLIAAEPTANQWVQQGLADHLVRCIDRRPQDIGGSVTFHEQRNSAWMAQSASLTGRLATIDLKSASDRLSCWLVQRIFRGNVSLLGAMAACRTRYVSNKIDKKSPTLVELRKFATMGSALTFPVQSVTFFVLAAAAVCYTRGWRAYNWVKACGSIQVYGDDIIVPVDALESLREILRAVGLVVNTDKTFSGLAFRESCGVEAFRGYDVTPVRPRRLFNRDGTVDRIACVDTANLLHERGLWYTARAVRSLVGSVGPVPTTRFGCGVWGDKSFVDPTSSPLSRSNPAKLRYNEGLHRYEIHLLQPKARKTESRRFEGNANLLQYFTEEPDNQFLTDWQSGTTCVTDAVISRRWVSLEALLGNLGM